MNPRAEALRAEILARVAEYYELTHRPAPFRGGVDRVPYAGRVYDATELQAGVEAVLEFWLTEGPWIERFTSRLAAFLGSAQPLAVNSGSSANLLAVAALRARQRPDALRAGDEVITPAATFPTTVAPLVQHGLIPVFVDCCPGSYNLDPAQLEVARSPRTRAIFVPHMLGNPADMRAIMTFARQHGLFVIEDACDALGSHFDGRFCGTFGDLATFSFYPAHHLTTGEGGAVLAHDPALQTALRTLRNWGRGCWCERGAPRQGACGRRYGWSLAPDGPYDHRYYFTEVGYNLKMTEPQAAIGVAQLAKLPDFIAARRRNFAALWRGLQPYVEYVALPTWSERAEPSWFAFPILVRDEMPFTRAHLVAHLEARGIETRYLFAGNILRHPGFCDIPHRVAAPLNETDRVMRHGFFIGVYPGLDNPQIRYMIDAFEEFFAAYGLPAGKGCGFETQLAQRATKEVTAMVT